MTMPEMMEPVVSGIDPTLHSSWKIALYYVYVDLTPLQVEEQITFHQALCDQYDLNGRVRISTEGLNGVLSGQQPFLQEYDRLVSVELARVVEHNVDLDVKYCLLREDLPIEPQLFTSRIIKETKNVISLFDYDLPTEGASTASSSKRHSKQSNRRRRRKEKHHQEMQKEHSLPILEAQELCRLQDDMNKFSPSTHLEASEWNDKLLRAQETNNSILVDVRNVYESRVGRFAAPNVPTLLTNTRKYSDLPHLLAADPNLQSKDEVFMYCTGGVRCERVSMLMQTLYPNKRIYQLQGGIQTYLRTSSADTSLFEGKNFVFDPRRTDPVHFGAVVGTCISCSKPHDDYDNGHAPSENKEARCHTCRMLVLVCNDCRPKFLCFGERDEGPSAGTSGNIPRLFCGLDSCIHEGALPEPEVLIEKVKCQ
eukprot:Nitzschia sp. Nitz4//scaffold59_size112058//39699//40970//NITZ4_004106-RA/size112058-processed-gene-0.40-mRNA-1//1//CDS//3329555114//2145//frame0